MMRAAWACRMRNDERCYHGGIQGSHSSISTLDSFRYTLSDGVSRPSTPSRNLEIHLNNNDQYLAPPPSIMKPKIYEDFSQSHSPSLKRRRCYSEAIGGVESPEKYLRQSCQNLALTSYPRQKKQKQTHRKGSLLSAAFNKINHM